MSFLINIDDFKGRYRISVSTFNLPTFQEYLNQVESQLLTEDFGIDFYLDVENNPTKDKYQDLLASGYKYYLLGGIYFYYQRDNFLSTSSGNSQINNSNSTNVPANLNSSLSSDRYNLGVDYFNRGAFDFLNDNAVKSLLINSSTDIGGGLWTLSVLDPEYLYASDVVTIANVDYIVESVDEMSGEVTIMATSDLSGNNLIYTPFEYSYFDKKETITQF